MKELEINETILKQDKGDYWSSMFHILYEQKRGEYIITNKRIIFKSFLEVNDFIVKYEDIESISKCCVGPLIRFIPTGIRIKTKNGKKYIMSIFGRKKHIEIIQNNLTSKGVL